MSSASSESQSPDPLDLTSLDADSLFNALSAVDKVCPCQSHPATFYDPSSHPILLLVRTLSWY